MRREVPMRTAIDVQTHGWTLTCIALVVVCSFGGFLVGKVAYEPSDAPVGYMNSSTQPRMGSGFRDVEIRDGSANVIPKASSVELQNSILTLSTASETAHGTPHVDTLTIMGDAFHGDIGWQQFGEVVLEGSHWNCSERSDTSGGGIRRTVCTNLKAAR